MNRFPAPNGRYLLPEKLDFKEHPGVVVKKD